MKALRLAIYISGFSFIFYGFVCLFSNGMKAEFKRFELEKLRFLTGLLELLGGVGLLVGLNFPPLLVLSSGGLFLMMATGIGIRKKAKDKWPAVMPAVFFMLLNFVICFFTLKDLFLFANL